MAVAALIVSIIAAIAAVLGFWATWRSAKAAKDSAEQARRSADAADATERRERRPSLTISRSSTAGYLDDRVLYRIRNDGPQDLDRITIYRPRPPDGVKYPLAVTSDPGGWVDDEIEVGPLRLTQEAQFSLCCGAGVALPDFLVRIECESGEDSWTLTSALPHPRKLDLSKEEYSRRKEVLTAAILEIERNVAILRGQDWARVPLEHEQLRLAEKLIRVHAPERIGPIRDLVGRIASFQVWVEQHRGTFRGDEISTGRDPMFQLLSDANAELEGLRGALDTPQASGARWAS